MKKAAKKTDLLIQAVRNADADFDLIGIGETLNVKLDDERHVAIELAKGRIADRWEGIRLELVSKERGLLETRTITFAEVFASLVDEAHPNRLEKYVWKYGEACSWYGKPTEADLESLRSQVRDYLKLVF